MDLYNNIWSHIIPFLLRNSAFKDKNPNSLCIINSGNWLLNWLVTAALL